MTKAEIISEISSRTGLEKKAVSDCIESFMDVVKDSMAKGENIFLRGFGTFSLVERAEKAARNINAGTPVIVPAHKVVKFKVSPDFRDMVR